MKAFRRHGEVISTSLDAAEVELLDSLAAQLISLLQDHGPASGHDGEAVDSNDPFSFWAKDLAAEPDEPEISDDPALQRLFPTAYPHDSQAASEFRRFTQTDLAQGKIDSAELVRAALAATDAGTRPLEIPVAQAQAWLKFYTNLRLVMAARLGIEDAESAEHIASLPPEDSRAFMISLYDWLGFAQETLIAAL